MLGCNQKMTDDSISDCYARVNMVICHISHMSRRMYVTNYSKRIVCNFYGCQLWDFQSKVTNKCYVVWRKSVRRILGVPYTTHCNLLHYIAEDRLKSSTVFQIHQVYTDVI